MFFNGSCIPQFEINDYFCELIILIRFKMSNIHASIHFKVPEPTLRRLPWYLAYAQLVLKEGEMYLSSTQIAKNIAVDASMVAKDLSYVNISGRTRVGYDVKELVGILESFLGFTNSHKAFLFGVGSLGGALMHDNGLEQFGLEIVAGFDVKYELGGTSINRVPIHHIDRFEELQRKTGINIGVLTVPVDKAQMVSELMIAGGIQAIWNFTPFRIRVPENIIVQNTSIYAHLAVMFNRLNAIKEEEKIRVLNQKQVKIK
jgi:redox-sensing transcriptional repressor